ncbi:hypothetical protein [Candidatus Villigracilis affinis]|uniref:hypothetical protein n=1 Tax=Candidatus Villigracilis affinis TaxID=3140682 RepID=UPI001DA8C21B|nr:hypothetical protein [Anaerolineales bacterium]
MNWMQEEVILHSEVMDNVEATAPGLEKDGLLFRGHHTCTPCDMVFLGMYMLPEFQALSLEQKQIAKWIILFHDIDKAHLRGRGGYDACLQSAVIAATTLPRIGFSITSKYPELIEPWSEYTCQRLLQLLGVNSGPNPIIRNFPESFLRSK